MTAATTATPKLQPLNALATALVMVSAMALTACTSQSSNSTNTPEMAAALATPASLEDLSTVVQLLGDRQSEETNDVIAQAIVRALQLHSEDENAGLAQSQIFIQPDTELYELYQQLLAINSAG